nr:hypothetical protein [Tanacetum cinerariifolium]
MLTRSLYDGGPGYKN